MTKEIIDIRRYLHMHPELGQQEFETSKYIKNYLDSLNISYKTYFNTGVCATIEGTSSSNNKKTMALRADIDALPLDDKKTCSYSSKNKGVMHACGHDAHTAILLGVAKNLSSKRDEFSGTVKLIFEPAEETVGGAKFMIEEGILENPKVDFICGLHVDTGIDTGKIKIKDNAVCASSNPFKIVITGKGGHGAYPASAIDPITCGSNIVSALQTIVSREIKPVNAAVITIGTFHGGTAPNIIPQEVEITGIIRTLSMEDKAYILERFRDLVNGIALSYRCTASIDIEESYPCLINDNEMTSYVKDILTNTLGKENVLAQQHPNMGVESFSYFANEIPAVFYFLGCRNTEKGIDISAHNSLFDIDEDCLELGVKLQSEIVLNYLK